MTDYSITRIDPASGSTSSFEQDFDDGIPRIGQFYWVKETATYDREDRKAGDTYEWLGCVMQIGSNYVELSSPRFETGYSQTRVLIDDIDDRLRFEPNADTIIAGKVAYYQSEVNTLLGNVREVTARLGVVPQQQIADSSQPGDNALAVLSEQVDTGAYKTALVKAKEETLPELFKKIEKANKMMAGWMTAPTLPMMAQVAPLKSSIGAIEDRIYTIELYAGLTEDAIKCRDGDPAKMGEKLHVMQRRLYMDEECLLNYTAGGMSFHDIKEFDEWISQSENMERLLPFPRTLVAFRVRRHEKEREDGGNMLNMFINFNLAKSDMYTYLYVRNGDQLWRIVADYEFDKMIFPDKSTFDPTEPQMVKMFAGRVDKMMSKREYDERMKEYRAIEKLFEEWNQANPGRKRFDNPHRHKYEYSFTPSEWKLFDQNNVYYDEANEKISNTMKRYNRVAVIIQGLFDRSLVLHPHLPVKVWSPDSFDAAITLVYDATATLAAGEKPDFEAYRRRLNALIDADSVLTGQDEAWALEMANRENKRQENDWRNESRNRSNYTRYRPYGNPGPGLVSTIAEFKPRVRKAVFRWMRNVETWSSDPKPAVISVSVDDLLNVSAYTPGDYRQFFQDHRTRQEYLKWAPLMLAAEDYFAGKINLNEPPKKNGNYYG